MTWHTIINSLENLLWQDQNATWRQMADQIGGEFTPRHFWSSVQVVKPLKGWRIVLDTFTRDTSNEDVTITCTRIRVRYNNSDGFWFSLRPTSAFDAVMKNLGLPDIEVGDPNFDRAFIIQSNDESKLRTVLADDRIRQWLEQQYNPRLEIKHYERLIPGFPGGIDELEFRVPWLINNPDLLVTCYECFVEVLNQLGRIGSALETEVGITPEKAAS